MNILLLNISDFHFAGQDMVSVVMVLLTLMAFLATWAINRLSIRRIKKSVNQTKEIATIMQHTLDMSHNYVLRLNLRQQRAYNLHGDLLPDEGLGYEESFNYIHPDDRHIYQEFIYRLFHGETITDECFFRWDMSGKKDLGLWRYMRDRGVAEYGNGINRPPTTIYCTMTDETEQMEHEKEDAELTDKYRKMFEQSIVGQAFYDKEGKLLTTNQKMREILKFQSEFDPYYYDCSLFDLPTFHNILNNRHIEDLYFCTKSMIIERSVNCYTELRVHPIYDENGEIYYITIAIRDVSQERELYLQNKKNDLEIRRANEEIQQYETELQYLMMTCNMQFFRTSIEKQAFTFHNDMESQGHEISFAALKTNLGDNAFAKGLDNPETFFNVPQTTLIHMRPFRHPDQDPQWFIIDSAPYFDNEGVLLGTYGVIRNVNDLIEKQEKLKQETERANDSGRLKSVFMANMTHEIRTPLNSIVGFSDVLPMLTTPEEKQEIVRVIMNNCDMLLRLINDILAISSLDAGGIHIEPREVDFAQSFNDICESLAERVQEPGVEFLTCNPYKTFVTCVDNGRIQQVITNFVTNAVKYTHQGHIKVGYDYRENGLYIYCEDTGTGIPKESQAKIFDRFVKLNDYIQGTGLGLSICKAIADGCHGEIGIESEGEGKGSTFWLWVPAEKLKSEN